MTQTHKLLVAMGVVALVGIAANRFPPAGKGGAGEACRRFAGEQRRTCYSQVLSERLRQHGVADAAKTLDALAASDGDAEEHAHELAHGIGIEAYSLASEIPATFTESGDGFSSCCRHKLIQTYYETRKQ